MWRHPDDCKKTFQPRQVIVRVRFMVVSDAYPMAPPRKGDDERNAVTLTRHGKRILLAAFNASRRSLLEVSEAIECSHTLLRTLLKDEEELGPNQAPVWTSRFAARLCHELQVPVWHVVAGLRSDHRKLLDAVDRVKRYAPDRYDAFIANVIEDADDKAALGGWSPSDATGPVRLKPRKSARPQASSLDDDA